jgi:hypothetical protein
MQERGALVASSLRPQNVVPQTLPRLPGPGWVYLYMAVEIGCQLALLTEVLAPARVLFRSAALGASLLLLVLIPSRPAFHHPSRNFAFAVVGILTLSMLNPQGGTPLAIVAHWAFCLAVIAPVFWVMRLELTEKTLVRLVLILWLFGTLSSILGILQVYYPGQFQPALSSMIRPDRALLIRLPSGAWVVRPMGLTDVPGGAGLGGFYATLFGLGIALAAPFRRARIAGMASMVVGIICIYLSQVRAVLVTLAICCIVLLALLAISGRISRLMFASVLALAIALLGFQMATSLGGDTVTSRLASLVADDPTTVYHSNRGMMVELAFNKLLPQYPLGAGLGRWGMVNAYFGNPEDLIAAEVQWQGWVADGGMFLVVAYPLAVIIAIWFAVRAALASAGGEFGVWGAVVAAHGVGTLALTFSYAVFMSTIGLQFWLLSAVFLRSFAARGVPQATGRPS